MKLPIDSTVYKGDIMLGNTVIVSDPCYDYIPNNITHTHFDNVKPGKYRCYISYFYDPGFSPYYRRVGILSIIHEDYKAEASRLLNESVYIDSGQCGIFDLEYYKQHHSPELDENWYHNRVCKATSKSLANPNFVEFEDSEYYNSKNDPYKYSQDELMELSDSSSGKTDKWTSMLADYMADRRAWSNDSAIGYKTINAADGEVFDGKAIISASGYGDFSPRLYVNKNAKGEITAIKINYM